MDAKLHEQELGSEGNLLLEVKGGKVVLSILHKSKGGEVSVAASLDPDYFIDKMAAAIPGKLDDAVLAILKGALKA